MEDTAKKMDSKAARASTGRSDLKHRLVSIRFLLNVQ